MRKPKATAAELRNKARMSMPCVCEDYCRCDVTTVVDDDALDEILAAARAEAVAPLEARVKELERDLALMTHSRDGFREAVIAGESTRARVKELTEVLRQLVEQIGKSVGFPPPQSQCATGHAYSDFAQAINAALALLAADQSDAGKAGKP